MADKTMSTDLYLEADLGYQEDNRVEPPLPIALVVICELDNPIEFVQT